MRAHSARFAQKGSKLASGLTSPYCRLRLLGDVGAEEAVPQDRNAGVVFVDVLGVDRVVNAMIARRIEHAIGRARCSSMVR